MSHVLLEVVGRVCYYFKEGEEGRKEG